MLNFTICYNTNYLSGYFFVFTFCINSTSSKVFEFSITEEEKEEISRLNKDNRGAFIYFN